MTAGVIRRSVAMISGLDIHDDLGDGHPLLGRRMPDLDLRTADGYVAWVGDLTYPGLPDVLATWFGAPTSATSRGSPSGRHR